MVDATARIENVKASLDSHVATQLETGKSLAVDWNSTDFKTKAVDAYIRPRLLNIARGDFYRVAGSAGEKGHDAVLIYQIDCFVKVAETTNRLRHMEIRDLVAEEFKVGTMIALGDYFTNSSNPSRVETLKCFEIDTDREIPEANGFQQWVFAVNIHYLEKF